MELKHEVSAAELSRLRSHPQHFSLIVDVNDACCAACLMPADWLLSRAAPMRLACADACHLTAGAAVRTLTSLPSLACHAST